ncbi:MAG: acylphosphatase [Candidatus Omnitrophota bacterium]
MQKQVNVFYSGSVQGVGFRFTARHIATALGVCGWVKNLDDGRVEILAEAEEKILENFLEEIKKAFGRYVDSVDINWQPAENKFKDFGVNF